MLILHLQNSSYQPTLPGHCIPEVAPHFCFSLGRCIAALLVITKKGFVRALKIAAWLTRLTFNPTPQIHIVSQHALFSLQAGKV